MCQINTDQINNALHKTNVNRALHPAIAVPALVAALVAAPVAVPALVAAPVAVPALVAAPVAVPALVAAPAVHQVLQMMVLQVAVVNIAKNRYYIIYS
jgi:hypothetical protein